MITPYDACAYGSACLSLHSLYCIHIVFKSLYRLAVFSNPLQANINFTALISNKYLPMLFGYHSLLCIKKCICLFEIANKKESHRWDNSAPDTEYYAQFLIVFTYPLLMTLGEMQLHNNTSYVLTSLSRSKINICELHALKKAHLKGTDSKISTVLFISQYWELTHTFPSV